MTVSFFSSVAGPPYPPNQYGGGGRGNYDSFRGQGGYPGKPRNNRYINYDILTLSRTHTQRLYTALIEFSGTDTITCNASAVCYQSIIRTI